MIYLTAYWDELTKCYSCQKSEFGLESLDQKIQCICSVDSKSAYSR